MNRTPLLIVGAALLLAVGFFVLGMTSDGDRDAAQVARSESGSAFGSLPSRGRRDGLAAGDDKSGGPGTRRRKKVRGEEGGRRALPGRARREDGSLTVVETERGRSGGVYAPGGTRGERLRDIARHSDLGDGEVDTDRIPEGLRARPDLHNAGDAAPAADAADPADPEAPASDAPDGKTFDPFSVYDNNRGPDEEPYLVDRVDFLDDEHGVAMGDDSVLTFPTEGNVRGDAGTIHFEIDPDWDGTEASTRTLLRIDEPGQWNNRVRVVKDNDVLRYMFFDNTGGEVNINVPISNWQAGDPHELTINWDGQNGVIGMYIDGELMAEQPYEGELILDSKSRLDLGSKGGDGYIGAGGRITNFTAYDRVLTPYDF